MYKFVTLLIPGKLFLEIARFAFITTPPLASVDTDLFEMPCRNSKHGFINPSILNIDYLNSLLAKIDCIQTSDIEFLSKFCHLVHGILVDNAVSCLVNREYLLLFLDLIDKRYRNPSPVPQTPQTQKSISTLLNKNHLIKSFYGNTFATPRDSPIGV